MNFKKIIATAAAAALAVSAMAVNAFALTTETHRNDATLYLVSEKPEEEKPSWITNSGYTIADVYGVTYHVEFNADEVADEATWIGGGMGANSNSTGWKQVEWGRSDKEITADLANGTITWLSDTPVFKDSDKYAQFWLQTWGGTVTVKSIDVLGKDGAVISDETPDPAEVPAEETTAAVEETTAAAETEAPEIITAADETAAETEAAPAETAAETTAETTAAATTDAPAKTGNTAAAAIAGVMAVAGAAAVVSRKRK